jgi:hypothetical protein
MSFQTTETNDEKLLFGWRIELYAKPYIARHNNDTPRGEFTSSMDCKYAPAPKYLVRYWCTGSLVEFVRREEDGYGMVNSDHCTCRYCTRY